MFEQVDFQSVTAQEAEVTRALPSQPPQRTHMKSTRYIQSINAAEFNGVTQRATYALDLALHYAIPETDDQSESEIDLPGYSRVRVASTPENWLLSGYLATNEKAIIFPPVDGFATVVCFSLGVSGIIHRVIPLINPRKITPNEYIRIPAGSIIIQTG